MKIRTQQQAEADLAPYIEDLFAVVRRGLQNFVQEQAELRQVYTSRSEASIIHDYMEQEAYFRFDEKPGILLTRDNNLFLMHIAGRYSIKPKKIGKRFRVSNIETPSVREFREHRQLHLDGVPLEPTNLFLGYLPGDSPGLMSSRVLIVCPRGQQIAWASELYEEEPLEERPAAVGRERGPRVRVRPIIEELPFAEPGRE